MIGVVDYGAGNLQSLGNALDHLDVSWRLAETASDFDACDRVILPGVGHFESAMHTLTQTSLDRRLADFSASGKPLLGICLGAQLLLESSEESPGTPGLGLIGGKSVRLDSDTVPHMGWNRVRAITRSCLLDTGPENEYFYFAHSYVCQPAKPSDCLGVTDCGAGEFCVMMGRDNVWGVQFHPEKSATAGLALLERFSRC